MSVATITTRSGRTRELPEGLDVVRVVGLDDAGRFVVDDFGALGCEPEGDHLFGLTLCCNAYDKGFEDGVYCRACCGGAPNADGGQYLFRAKAGGFPGLDPVYIVSL